jgi:hypothetical protein
MGGKNPPKLEVYYWVYHITVNICEKSTGSNHPKSLGP